MDSSDWPRVENAIRRLVIASRLLLVLLVLLGQSAAAATIAISLANRPGATEIEGSALLNADAGTAWRVLTDYEGYIDFIPGLQGSRIVARKGATVTVEESGDVTLGLVHRSLDVTFEVTEIAPTRLVSHVVAGDLRTLKSCYMLTTVGNRVRLQYIGQLDTEPALFGAIERLALKQNVARRFQALADEIERQSAVGRTPSRVALPGEGASPSAGWTAASAC